MKRKPSQPRREVVYRGAETTSILAETYKYIYACDLLEGLGYASVGERSEDDVFLLCELEGYAWDGENWRPDEAKAREARAVVKAASEARKRDEQMLAEWNAGKPITAKRRRDA